jgi:AcrR family transcriptional regulator
MPRDTLTRDQIVTAAIELLDAEGLEGLNMRALGQRLGSAATAVYWHVGNKANLITLAGDQMWHDEIALPDPAATGWRPAVTRMATDLHAMFTRHPWVVQAFGSFVIFGPGKARQDDHALALFEAAGFTGARVGQAATAVFTFVLGNALGPAAGASITRKLSPEQIRDSMTKAQEIATQFPRLRAGLETSAAEYAAAPDNTFEFGLHAILDGLEAQLPKHSEGHHTNRAERARSTRPGGDPHLNT